MYNQYQNQAGIGSQSQYQNKFQPTGYVQSSYGQNQFQNSQYGSYQNPQSFHTANYRGNQPGHDSYLRSDSQTPAQQQGFGQGSYGLNQSFGSQAFGNQGNQSYTSQQQGYGQFASPQSYHTANYRGDQPGHDSYLRSDSQTPAQQQGFGQASFGLSQSTAGQGYGSQNFGSQSYGQAYGQGYGTQSYSQAVSPQSYHTANYRGDQPAHDSYLNSDSQTPAQQQFGGGFSSSVGSAQSGRINSGLPYTTGTF